MSSGSPDSATQRDGPLPSQKSGRTYAGTNPGKANARGESVRGGGEVPSLNPFSGAGGLPRCAGKGRCGPGRRGRSAPAHPPRAGGGDPLGGTPPAVMLAPGFRERLVSPLDDPL